jgi:hypothetical protein
MILLADLRAAGLRLETVAGRTTGTPSGRLKVTPRSGLTPELDAAIRENVAELLRHLSHVAPDGRAVAIKDTRESRGNRTVVWEWEVEAPEMPKAAKNEALRSLYRLLSFRRR